MNLNFFLMFGFGAARSTSQLSALYMCIEINVAANRFWCSWWDRRRYSTPKITPHCLMIFYSDFWCSASSMNEGTCVWRLIKMKTVQMFSVLNVWLLINSTKFIWEEENSSDLLLRCKTVRMAICMFCAPIRTVAFLLFFGTVSKMVPVDHDFLHAVLRWKVIVERTYNTAL